MTSTTHETVASVTSIQAANEWLAQSLRSTRQMGGLYPSMWDPTYHEQFRAALDAGALLVTSPPSARLLADAICGATNGDTFANFQSDYRNDLGRWLLEQYPGYLVRAFPVGSRWACATNGADFSGFRTHQTLQRVSYVDNVNGVDQAGRVYFRRVGDDDTTVGGTQFLYPASIVPLVPTTVGFPTPPDGFTNYHQSAIQAAEVWVNDGINDVATGVDAQMVTWSEWWPNDECGSDAAAKDYASALMEQKCRTLGIPFPVVAETPVREPVDPDRASLDWDQATPLVPGETLPAMTVLLMAAEPRTAGGGGVYFGNRVPVLVHLVNSHVVTEGAVTSPSVRRVDGRTSEHGSMTQVVGEEYLRHPAVPAVEPTPEPVRDTSEEDRLREALARAREQHRQDIQTIGETLIREATRRNWCSEYDEIVDGINARITVELPLRRREHEVVISGYIRVPFSYSMTVEAEDADDAYEIASETWSDQVGAGDLLRNYTEAYDAEIEDDYEIEVQ